MHIILISLHKIFSWIFCRNVYHQSASVTAHRSLVTVTLELYLANICLLFAIYSGFQPIKIVLSRQANIKLRRRHSHGVRVWLDVNFVFKPLNIFLKRGHSLWMSAHFQWFLTLSPLHSCPHLAPSSVLVDTNFAYVTGFFTKDPTPNIHPQHSSPSYKHQESKSQG